MLCFKVLMEIVAFGGDLTTGTSVGATVDVVKAYNEEVKAFNEQVQEVNEERRKQGSNDFVSMVPEFVCRKDEQALRKHALRFQKKWGFSSHEQKKPARHLPYNHPHLAKMRYYVDAATMRNLGE